MDPFPPRKFWLLPISINGVLQQNKRLLFLHNKQMSCIASILQSMNYRDINPFTFLGIENGFFYN